MENSDVIAPNDQPIITRQIRITGTVQGVGFRPVVWRIATRLGISGKVLNDGQGVLIEATASSRKLQQFIEEVQSDCPPLGRIEQVTVLAENAGATPASPCTFQIVQSCTSAIQTNVVPDAATCAACLEDVSDPAGRRYDYPFTNCTHCGPRFSIIRAIPYDRSNTSMSQFKLCDKCLAEYENPADRRFHAQPNACSSCGPDIWIERLQPDGTVTLPSDDPIRTAAALVTEGKIVAIKGIGGFHLAVTAENEEAVALLRTRKRRYAKPFAVMVRDLATAKKYCRLSSAEEQLLSSTAAPIVILEAQAKQRLAASVAPGGKSLGVMLPYTPLHHLLMKHLNAPIVLTSGNVSDEPQCISNEEVASRLGAIADYALMHNREIVNRVDDSVARLVAGGARVLRRGRGYAPEPIALPAGFENAPAVLALGGQLKNSICLLKNGKAIISQHIGDLEDGPTYFDYKKNIALYGQLFEHKPEYIAVDMHPDYASTILGRSPGQKLQVPVLSIQHHHAHIASCLAENGYALDGPPVLGIALDGLRFGFNGELWGGEFLLADYSSVVRAGTFKPVALLGGSLSMKEPWRNTYAHIMAEMGWQRYNLEYSGLELTDFLNRKPLSIFNKMLQSGFQAPQASSCGRLFDAVAAAVNICRETAQYEGQAAVELEQCINAEQTDHLYYPFTIPRLGGTGLPYIEPLAMWHALLSDLLEQIPVPIISWRFHRGLALIIASMVNKLTTRDAVRHTNTIALSGGVFQNKTLSELLIDELHAQGYNVLTQRRVPSNDGGISLGQAVIAAARQIKQGTAYAENNLTGEHSSCV